MNDYRDFKPGCQCMKKIQNIEFTSYICDPKCLTKLLNNQSIFHKMSQPGNNICDPPQSALGNNTCKYFFSTTQQEKIDKSKYELKLKNGVGNSLQAVDSLSEKHFEGSSDLKMRVGDKKNKNHVLLHKHDAKKNCMACRQWKNN